MWLLAHQSPIFSSWSIKSENPSLPMVSMDHVFLKPSCILKSSKMIWAVDIKRESTILHVIATWDALILHKRLNALYTNLIVIFNLKILVLIVENAWQIVKIPLIVVFIFVINFIRPPSLYSFKFRFYFILHVCQLILCILYFVYCYLCCYILMELKNNIVVLQELCNLIVLNCLLENHRIWNSLQFFL